MMWPKSHLPEIPTFREEDPGRLPTHGQSFRPTLGHLCLGRKGSNIEDFLSRVPPTNFCP